jgi:hypothetical protein
MKNREFQTLEQTLMPGGGDLKVGLPASPMENLKIQPFGETLIRGGGDLKV